MSRKISPFKHQMYLMCDIVILASHLLTNSSLRMWPSNREGLIRNLGQFACHWVKRLNDFVFVYASLQMDLRVFGIFLANGELFLLF